MRLSTSFSSYVTCIVVLVVGRTVCAPTGDTPLSPGEIDWAREQWWLCQHFNQDCPPKNNDETTTADPKILSSALVKGKVPIQITASSSDSRSPSPLPDLLSLQTDKGKTKRVAHTRKERPAPVVPDLPVVSSGDLRPRRKKGKKPAVRNLC